MEISEWLEKENVSLLQLAHKAGVSPSTLYDAFSQKRGVTERIAIKVSKATKGKVSVEEAMKKPRKKFKDTRKMPKVQRCSKCGK